MLLHRDQRGSEEQSLELPETKSNQLALTQAHPLPSVPIAIGAAPAPGSWLGMVAGVAPRIKIAPLVTELGCQPERCRPLVEAAVTVRGLKKTGQRSWVGVRDRARLGEQGVGNKTVGDDREC